MVRWEGRGGWEGWWGEWVGQSNRSGTVDLTESRCTHVQVKAASVRVHSIAVSREADASLELVAKETGGLSFAYSDTTPSNTLNDAFLAMSDAGVREYY